MILISLNISSFVHIQKEGKIYQGREGRTSQADGI